MNAQQIIETARQHWDKDAASEHGFTVLPGDAVLHHGAQEDDPDEYRVVQLLDIVHPTDQPDAVRGLVGEYVVTETEELATYEITVDVDSGSIPPHAVNDLLDPQNDKHIYELDRTDDNIFELPLPESGDGT